MVYNIIVTGRLSKLLTRVGEIEGMINTQMRSFGINNSLVIRSGPFQIATLEVSQLLTVENIKEITTICNRTFLEKSPDLELNVDSIELEKE